MIEYINILKKFKESPYSVMENEKEYAKLIAAINKSIKVLQKDSSRKKSFKF